METIEINGERYHARSVILDDGMEKLFPIVDEYGNLIPSDICICSARGSYECVCGAWDSE